MSYDLFLIRVARRVRDSDEQDPVPIPFGASPEELTQLILAAPGFKRRGKGPRLEFSVTGDPADCIIVQGASPQDLLPLVKALREYRPLAIYDPQTTDWLDPSELSSDDPQPWEPIFQPPIQPKKRDYGPLRIIWAMKMSPAYFGTGTIPYGGLLYSSAQRETAGNRNCLTAFDPRTGKTVWTIRCGHGKSQVILAGDVLVTAGDSAHVYGIDPATGAMRWRVPKKGRCDWPYLEFDEAAGTISVRHDLHDDTIARTLLTTGGEVVSRTREPWRPPDYAALNADAERKLALYRGVAVDAKRSVLAQSALQYGPPPIGGTGDEHLDDRRRKERDEFHVANQTRTKLIFFDLATGERLFEQVIVLPEELGRGGMGHAAAVKVGEVLCVFNGPYVYGLSLDADLDAAHRR